MGWKEVNFLIEALFPSPTPLKKKGGSRREDKYLIRNGQICLHPMQSGSGNRLGINSGRKFNLFTNF